MSARFTLRAERELGSDPALGTFPTAEAAAAWIVAADDDPERAEGLEGADLVLTDGETGQRWLFLDDGWERIDA